MKLSLVPVLLLIACISQAQTFTLTSSTLGGQATQKEMLKGFGCKGDNLSPQLKWENPPAGTKSFALTIYDENAPTGSGWWHWIVFDIDPSIHALPAGAGNKELQLLPAHAIQSRTDFGVPGYGGPCPPPGDKPHRYVVTVFALDTEKLGLDENASPAMVGYTIHQHSLSQASLIFYAKQ